MADGRRRGRDAGRPRRSLRVECVPHSADDDIWVVDLTGHVDLELAILMLGFASFAGGLWMRRVGPRPVAIAGGICYGLGTILAGQADGNIWRLYLTYGVLGGIGLGLG